MAKGAVCKTAITSSILVSSSYYFYSFTPQYINVTFHAVTRDIKDAFLITL